MLRPLSLGFALLPSLLVAGPPQRTGRTPAEILAEYQAFAPPRVTIRASGDPYKIMVDDAISADATRRKVALIGELIEVAPSSAEAAQLAPIRWQVNSCTPEEVACTRAEIATMLAKNKRPILKAEAYHWETWQTLVNLPDKTAATMMPAIEGFIRRFPTDPRGATLLQYAAGYVNDPGRKAEILARAEHDYPDTPTVRLAIAKRQRASRVGRPFDLEFSDAVTGSPVSMKQFRGKVVVVDFWSTWSRPWASDLPRMKRIYAAYHSKGVVFIGINLDQLDSRGEIAQLKQFLAAEKVSWPQYCQGDGLESKFSASWGIDTVPALFLIDAAGNLASVAAREDLETLIPKYLAERKSSDR